MFLNNKKNIMTWVGFHLLILILTITAGKFKINTSLYDILPETNESKKIANVENTLSKKINSSLLVLIGSNDFTTTKEISYKFKDDVVKSNNFANISLELNDEFLDSIRQHLHKFRHQFLSKEVKEIISSEDIKSLSERAYFTLTSPISMGFLDNIDSDPFMLSYESFQSFFNSGLMGNMSLYVKDSLMTRDLDGVSWVLMTMDVKDSGVVSNSNKSPINEIYNISGNLHKLYPDSEFVFSGVPFHTYESTKESKRQISTLSTISTIFIILLLLLAFKSLKPLFSTVIAITFGMLTGFCLTLIVFKQIHLFTIVFGTSLIGISVDYCFHFFTEWVDRKRYRTNRDVVKYILPGITVGLITTLVSYGAFTISPFPLLQQIALFSIAGLLSSFISVLFLFPVVGNPKQDTIERTNTISNLIFKVFILPSKYKKIILPLLLILTIPTLIVGLRGLNLNNNIRDLYKMSDKLFNWEVKSSQILEHGSSGLYMIIEGEGLEENLQTSEEISTSLDKLVSENKMTSYLSLSTFLPSIKTQEDTLKLINTNLSKNILTQLEFIGFDSSAYSYWKQMYDKDSKNYMTLEDIYKLPINSFIDKVNIGEVDNIYYSAIQLFGVKDPQGIVDISKKNKNVYFVNKVEETTVILQDLSILAIIIICFSYFIICLGLVPRYGLKSSLKIVLVPLLASLITLSIVNIIGHPINIFVIVGLILIPGMGTDYLILITESKKLEPQVILSISLSMATTVLSFGMLGFTSIAGAFGLTVSLGIFTTYILTSIFHDTET